MVFQSYALYPHMTVRENLEFGLKIRKMPQAEIDKLVDDAAEHPRHRPPPRPQAEGAVRRPAPARGASGGRSCGKPSVFLFDEPLSNLDAKLRVQMRAEIAKLQQRLKTTTIYVTHDQVEAMTMGHRIAVLQGRRPQAGRHAAGALRSPREPVRRELHRHAADELHRGHDHRRGHLACRLEVHACRCPPRCAR